uniref:SGNH hydrolase-type esterase domain-containing protein n=1 Tax=Neogobius melanostomus TaxID=47308 RepID=A0A8C6UNV1_9GOBI
MATPSTSASFALSCSVCRMSSQNPASFTDDRSSCVKCSVVVALEARVSELEERLSGDVVKASVSYSQIVAGTAVRSNSAREVSQAEASPAAGPVQPGQDQDGFVTVRGGGSAKRTPVAHQTLHVQNRFSPLSATPAEPDTLVIGSSIVRDVKIPAALVRCYPGARVGDIEGNLKRLKQGGRRFRRIVIHAGGNDVRRRQSEVLKLQVGAVCELAKTMSDTVIYSGPLPNLVNDEMYSRHLSFNCWLSRWCEQNDVGYVNNWSAFWGKPKLMRRDG